jgi:hypothetical protein
VRKNSTGDLVSPAFPEIESSNQRDGHRSACYSPELEAMSTVKRRLDARAFRGFDGSIKDEKASNVGPAGIDIA